MNKNSFALNTIVIKRNAYVAFVESLQNAIREGDKELIERTGNIMRHQSTQVAIQGAKCDQQVL